MRGVVLLLAAGEGTRLGRGPKGFVEVCGVPLVRRAADTAAAAALVDAIVAAVPPGAEDRAREVLAGVACPLEVVAGGASRQGSAARALGATDAAAVAVHDAARALCPPVLFDRVLEALDGAEAVVPVLAVGDTIKEAADGVVVRTLDRSRLVAVQTPQAFRADAYKRAHEAAARDGVEATDDAALVERIGVPVHVVEGDPCNLKITTPHDVRVAEALL